MRISLPIDSSLPEILDQIRSSPNFILQAEPGAGKTTRLPPKLLALTGKKILVLEPRRLAAVAAAHRIADEESWRVGVEVGYQVRFSDQTSAVTRLVFVTEALLARKMLSDPTLSEYGIIVLDEFHERSLHTDLAIGLLKDLQVLERADLRIVVMSATLDPQPIVDFLGDCQVRKVPGKSHPLEVRRIQESQLLRLDDSLLQRIHRELDWLRKEKAPAVTLVFLPGLSEIRRTLNFLRNKETWKTYQIEILHGNLSLQDQQRVVQRSEKPKIILSTNVAESALTIEGVTAVVDCGLARRALFDPATDLTELQTIRIAKANAQQRAGRAARQSAGIVVQLWNATDELSMVDFEPPAILREDLTESFLLLAGLGYRMSENTNSLSWLTPPPAAPALESIARLQRLKALAPTGSLTDLGKLLLRWPLTPELGCLLASGIQAGLADVAVDLVAVIAESRGAKEVDLMTRLHNFQTHRNESDWQRTLMVSRQLRQSVSVPTKQNSSAADLEVLVLKAFANRLCRRRRANQPEAQMATGVGVKLADPHIWPTNEYFIALEFADAGLVTLGLPVALSDLEHELQDQVQTQFEFRVDAEGLRPAKFRVTRFAKMMLSQSGPIPLNETEIAEHLVSLAVDSWDWLLRQNPNLANWWERWLWFCDSVSTEKNASETNLRELQTSALELACFGERNLLGLAQKDLVGALEQTLGRVAVAEFHKLCPATLTVPSGRQLALRYQRHGAPILEVRIQEVFGWTETPQVGAGTAIVLHLLGPNYRPVQVTQDLRSFWKTGYLEVRKELRARYPKHSWPEDPWTAPAVARGRSQRK